METTESLKDTLMIPKKEVTWPEALVHANINIPYITNALQSLFNTLETAP